MGPGRFQLVAKFEPTQQQQHCFPLYLLWKQRPSPRFHHPPSVLSPFRSQDDPEHLGYPSAETPDQKPETFYIETPSN